MQEKRRNKIAIRLSYSQADKRILYYLEVNYQSIVITLDHILRKKEAGRRMMQFLLLKIDLPKFCL